MGIERKPLNKECGWKDGDRGGSTQKNQLHQKKEKQA
jgi:hypothetical protein